MRKILSVFMVFAVLSTVLLVSPADVLKAADETADAVIKRCMSAMQEKGYYSAESAVYMSMPDGLGDFGALLGGEVSSDGTQLMSYKMDVDIRSNLVKLTISDSSGAVDHSMYADDQKMYYYNDSQKRYEFEPIEGEYAGIISGLKADFYDSYTKNAINLGTKTITTKDMGDVECVEISLKDTSLVSGITGLLTGEEGSTGLSQTVDVSIFIGVEDNLIHKKVTTVTSEVVGFSTTIKTETDYRYDEKVVTMSSAYKKATLAQGYVKSVSGVNYSVVYESKKPVFSLVSVSSNKKNIKAANTIEILGKSYKVTSVGAASFDKATKAKKVTLPKNIKKVGKNAFAKCTKLKTLSVKNKSLKKKLKKKKAKKKAGIRTKAKIK